MSEHAIDFIITWVDGSDPEWQAEKAKYKGGSGDQRNSRYRDWDNLKYLLRSIEKNAPWVNRVFLVTCGHTPSWLNKENEKLVLVKHSDYIPEEFLPTFSSRAIDMNFHRIEELSEHFVYFNDDMLLTSPVTREDFFKNGLPCDTAILRPAVINVGKAASKKTTEMYITPVIDMTIINRHFNKKAAIRKNRFKWYSLKYGKEMFKTLSLGIWNFFPGIREYHCCYSYLKQTYKDVWAVAEEALTESCMHKFRVNTDYNHWVFSYWQMAKGQFYPRSPKFGLAYSLCDDDEENKRIYGILRSRKLKLTCINDSVSEENYERILKEFTQVMTELFPEKSSFEK